MFDFSVETIIGFLYAIPGVMFALSIHELSHGYVAYKLGDPTAKNMGRLTLNPMKHIDPIGLIAMFLVHVGWAKPVPINSRYFKKPKRDIALTALAGPVANLISAFIGFFVYYIFFFICLEFFPDFIQTAVFGGIITIIQSFLFLNIGLAIFNLIPIPPLDGSRILDAFLPPKVYLAYHKYEDIVRIALLVLLITDIISIAPVVDFVFIHMSTGAFYICDAIRNLIF